MNLRLTISYATAAAALLSVAKVCAAEGEAVAAVQTTPVYTNYMDWQLRAVVVSDTNADNNVRRQMDLTVPLHGPWLLNPAPDSITVNWITRAPCGVALEYREKDAPEFTRVWKTTYGQIDYSSDLHTFHLTGLKPATTYEYRLTSTVNGYFSYYTDVYVGREIYSFRTIDPKRENYKVFVTADFHGGSRLILDPMIDRSGAADADFYFFLGDIVEDSMDNARFFITFGFLDDVSRRWGAFKPSIFLRGNHDFHGRESYRWGDFFPRRDGKSYLAFSQGPALFVGLDSMGGGSSPAQKQQVDAYLKEQADWIAGLKRDPLWRKSTFRVVMAHYGTHGMETAHLMEPVFKEVLNDNTPAGRIHLFLAGHEHLYIRIDPRASASKVNAIPKNYKLPAADFNYTEVVCALTEGMTIDVAPRALTVRSHFWNRPEGGLRDAFEIHPDGTVKDLMEVKTFPFQR